MTESQRDALLALGAETARAHALVTAELIAAIADVLDKTDG